YVKCHSQNNDKSFDYLLDIRVDTHQVHNVLQKSDDKCTGNRSAYSTDTAGKGCTADDGCGKSGHLITNSTIGKTGIVTCHEDHTCHTNEKSVDQVRFVNTLLGIDTTGLC